MIPNVPAATSAGQCQAAVGVAPHGASCSYPPDSFAGKACTHSEAGMRQSLAAASLYRIRVKVDFEALQDVLLFWRGASLQPQTVKSWFGLRSRENEFINYDRVPLFIHFKPDACFADRNRVPEISQPGTTAIELFRDCRVRIWKCCFQIPRF